MLTPEDIKNLTEYQLEVFKDVFATKEDLDGVKASLNTLQRSVDGLAKNVQTVTQESAVMVHRMKNAEDWIDKAAPKLEIEFKH